jgi:hypothetical protein
LSKTDRGRENVHLGKEFWVKEHRDTAEVDLLEPATATASVPGIVRGTLLGFTQVGAPLVALRGLQLQARTCISLGTNDVGKEVLAVFESHNPETPIVLGVIRPETPEDLIQISVDGRSITVRAEEHIALKCGRASITLHRDGKIVIRGAYVVSHASGVNRIRGGSVELN